MQAPVIGRPSSDLTEAGVADLSHGGGELLLPRAAADWREIRIDLGSIPVEQPDEPSRYRPRHARRLCRRGQRQDREERPWVIRRLDEPRPNNER
jgi:hypothetical protein